MIAWPERIDKTVVIHFLQDCSLFVYLLRESYRSAIDDTPALTTVFLNRSRLQIAITNDVLQCFVPNPPEGEYSMIRHHALMHLVATLWLGTVNRRKWFDLYRSGEPAAIRLLSGHRDITVTLKEVEDRAFGLFRELGSLTHDERGIVQLLGMRGELNDIATYLSLCGVAIGLLGREYFGIPVSHRRDWLRTQIHSNHPRAGFLIDAFTRLVH